MKGNQCLLKSTKVLIISYDLYTKYQDELANMNFRVSIVDEAHYLKNPNAKRTEALVPRL